VSPILKKQGGFQLKTKAAASVHAIRTPRPAGGAWTPSKLKSRRVQAKLITLHMTGGGAATAGFQKKLGL
jgi:hypothetical protein